MLNAQHLIYFHTYLNSSIKQSEGGDSHEE